MWDETQYTRDETQYMWDNIQCTLDETKYMWDKNMYSETCW